ncbi:MAG: hypothetical protein ACPGLV_12935, partial [Bacteroidia bacterium]
MAQNCETDFNLFNIPVICKTNTPPKKKTKSAKAVQNNEVVPWKRTHGSPDYNPTPAISSPGCLTLRSMAKGWLYTINATEGFAQKVAVLKGKPYVFAMNYHRGNSNSLGNDNIKIEITDVLPNNGFNNNGGKPTVLPSNYTSSQTLINKPATNASWTKETVCFTASKNFGALWVYNNPGAKIYGQKRYLITHFDDFELIENFDFALRDTSI